MLKAGERIGDWIIDRPLGEGGMGAVYRVHSALSERVDAALKVMKPSMESDARARFVREAEALSALRHPAIIRVMGFSEDSRRGLLYLVMDLADGETLKRRLERGPMALPEALATFVPLAGGLEHAHAAGIFHRDIKPSNVILSPDGVRLVDFGIAAAANTGELTGAGHIGTLSYLPPEVFRGERAEPRMIDVYGFGLLLNEALTGTHPFPLEPGLTPAAALATVGMRKLQQPALDPGEGVPQAVRDLVRRATDSNPALRPDMAEIRRVLASLVERRAGSAAAAAPAGPAAPARVPAWTPQADATMRVPDPVLPPGRVPMRDGTTSHTRRRFRERRRSVIVAWVASMLAAALMAALIIMMVRGNGGGSAVPETSPSPTALPAGGTAIVQTPVPRATPRPSTTPTPSPSPSPTPSASATPKPPSPPPSAQAPAPSPRVSISPGVPPSPASGPPAGAVVRPSTPAPHPSPQATPPPSPEETPEPSPSPAVSPSPPLS
jgi:eukaryotic-like serine/threonine-protein kinase